MIALTIDLGTIENKNKILTAFDHKPTAANSFITAQIICRANCGGTLLKSMSFFSDEQEECKS